MKDKGSGPGLFAATGVLGGDTIRGCYLPGITAAAVGWWAGSKLS